jgi:hypothetical protein
MPFFFVLAAPLALVGVVAFALARRRTSREAVERPSIEAAERIARGLSARLEDGSVLRVHADVEGARVVCSISRGAPISSVEVPAGASVPSPFHLTLHRVAGRELADYPKDDVLLATSGGPQALWGASSPRLAERLPRNLRAEMERVGASWITVKDSSVTFVGLEAPTSEDAWPRFRDQLQHALKLGPVIVSASRDAG